MGDEDVLVSRDATEVVFHLPPGFGARHVDVAGDFTAWVPLPMDPLPGGAFCLALRFERGRRLRYRFLLDGEQWMNDPTATDFETAPSGGAVSARGT
jgi:1,4-alpha-glucan branching enzyme